VTPGRHEGCNCRPTVVRNVVILTHALVLAPLPAAAAARERPAAGEPPAVRLTTAAVTERIPLPRLRGPVELEVDALAQRIRIRAPRDAAALGVRFGAHTGAVCPKVSVQAGVVELGCRTRRFEARLSKERSGQFLDIDELRGLPWRAGKDAAPRFHYDPFKIGLGRPCPGVVPVSRGECALKSGETLEAALEFRDALETSSRSMAAVRLGDLALDTGDPATAAGWYHRAGTTGSFGRVAIARQCELDGKCLATSDGVREVFNAAGLPEPLRADMLMRRARAEIYLGHVEAAAQVVAGQMRAHGYGSLCREGAELLCRRIILDAMRLAGAPPPGPAKATKAAKPTAPDKPDKHPPPAATVATSAGGAAEQQAKQAKNDGGPETDPETTVEPGEGAKALSASETHGAPAAASETHGAPAAAAAAAPGVGGVAATVAGPASPEYIEALLEAYLGVTSWEKGPLAVELSQAAAPLAAKLGAPVFGGNLLATLVPEVPSPGMSAHLLMATEIFLDGQNFARARVIAEFAQTRLPKADLAGPRWTAVMKALAGQPDDDLPPSTYAALNAELKAAAADLRSARDVLGKAKGLLGGARDARGAAGQGQTQGKSRKPAAGAPGPSPGPAERKDSRS
jgi:hypothetical protein